MPKAPKANLDKTKINPQKPGEQFHVHADQPMVIHAADDGVFVEEQDGVRIVVDLQKIEGGVSEDYLAATLDRVETKLIRLTVPRDKFTHREVFADPGMTVTVTNPGTTPTTQAYPMTYSATYAGKHKPATKT